MGGGAGTGGSCTGRAGPGEAQGELWRHEGGVPAPFPSSLLPAPGELPGAALTRLASSRPGACCSGRFEASRPAPVVLTLTHHRESGPARCRAAAAAGEAAALQFHASATRRQQQQQQRAPGGRHRRCSSRALRAERPRRFLTGRHRACASCPSPSPSRPPLRAAVPTGGRRAAASP